MTQVNYRFYEDRDAEGVLELFRRNKYYLGKRPVSADQLREAIADRGTYFAVIGEDDERIIAYIAAYPTGDGKVCRKHQIVMGGLLVDEEYRGRLYSISNIYIMMVLKIIEMKSFTTIIGEVESFRKQSLLMHRYFGSVMVNRVVKHAPQVNQMYNFLPGYFLLFDEESESRKEKMTKFLPKADKRGYDREDEIIDDEYVNTHTVHSYGELRLLVHIHTGIVEEIELKKNRLELALSRDRKRFMIKKRDLVDADDAAAKITIRLWKDGEISEETKVVVTGSSEREISVEGGIEKIHASIEGINDSFWFYPVRPVEIKRSDREELWGLPDYSLDKATGYFTIKTGETERIAELWPFMNRPYLIGDLEPDFELALERVDTDEADSCREMSGLNETGCLRGSDVFRFRRNLNGCTVLRDYCKIGNEILIRTLVRAEKPIELKPKFQFMLRDAEAKVSFITYKADDIQESFDLDHMTEGWHVTEMHIDEERDLKIASAEIPFERFVKEPYSEEPLKRIIVEADNYSWSVETSKKTTAYLQFNYVGIVYDMSDVLFTNGCYDFGEIRITINKDRR